MAYTYLTLFPPLGMLEYFPSTGIFVWLRTFGSRAKIGDVAGYIDYRGYISIRLAGRSYLAHRLAFLYMTGEWPTNHIDHIDGNPSNNRFDNLREATNSENLQNLQTARSDNKSSGLLGAYPNGTRWMAKIKKNYTCHYIGTFDTPEEAHEAYLNAKRSIHPYGTL